MSSTFFLGGGEKCTPETILATPMAPDIRFFLKIPLCALDRMLVMKGPFQLDF